LPLTAGMGARSATLRIGSKHEGGQDLVEYALIAPIFFLLFLGIIEFSLIVWRYDTIASVAREGARYGIIPGRTEAQVEAYAATRALGLSPGPAIDATMGSSTVRVDVTYTFDLLTSPIVEAFGGTGTVTLHATSVMNRE
jgi:Flp pilus assembly protein TadG